MPNFKVTNEEKLQAVLEYLNEDTSQKAVAKKYGVSLASFQTWVRKYEAEGEIGLQPSATYKKYSKETKYSAVLEYLSGTTSQEEICKKYRISSKTQLQRWILWYNGHNELKNSPSGGNKLMTKARKTTFDERIEIVKYALDNNNDYKGAADKFLVPYANVYKWVKIYNEQGEEGLKEHRGRPKKSITELTELEKKDLEIARLKLELEKHKRAEEILKKNLEIRKQLFKGSHK